LAGSGFVALPYRRSNFCGDGIQYHAGGAGALGNDLCAALQVTVEARRSEPALVTGCGGVYFDGRK